MGADITEVLNLGPCTVTVNSVNVGHTGPDGVKVTMPADQVEAFAGKWGKKAPVKAWIATQAVEAEFTLIQTNMVDLVNVFNGLTKVTSGADSKITVGKIAGSPITAVPVVFTPINTSNTPTYDFTIPYAVPVGNPELLYTGDKFQEWKCKFRAHVNEASGADGSYLATFGDVSISADLVNPTCTVVPLDAAAAVSVNTTVVWTFSKNLDSAAVNSANVKLIEAPVGAAAYVAGTIVLSNAGAATTITFTPTAALTAATQYLAVLTSGIKDMAGNALAAGKVTDFTTE